MTGWDIVLDLIGKLAALERAKCEPNPEEWYHTKYGEAPDYAVLLEKLAKTGAERTLLLRQYFEPTEEEKAAKQKMPSAAHKAIASLVSRGFIRVIVTTNFDTLIEQALEAQGIQPIVITTPDAITGMMPLVHNKCTVLKLHGDYRDTRIKNTEEELSSYEDSVDRLLDQILDEYGLIICGWSADWDTALRAAIERYPNRRFSTYWTVRNTLTENAKRLIDLRGAQEIRISDADSFFTTLESHVLALEEYSPPSPRSKQMAVSVLKRNLENGQRIVIGDTLTRALQETQLALHDDRFSPQNPQPNPETVLSRMRLYESQTETLAALFATVCYWGDDTYHDVLVRLLEQIGARRKSIAGDEIWDDMRTYPAMLLMYTGGFASMVANRYDTMAALLIKAKIRTQNYNRLACDELRPTIIVSPDLLNQTKEYKLRKTPMSEHLYNLIRQWLQAYILGEDAFDEMFDRFEYLFALACAQRSKKIYLGRFAWKYHGDDRDGVMGQIGEEIKTHGTSWPPLMYGLLEGPIDKLLEIKAALDERAKILSLSY